MEAALKRKIKWMLIFFIVALVLSGITAFPVYTELKWAKEHHLINTGTIMGRWLQKVWEGVDETNSKHHFMFYGYDWLAFAHIIIALAFIGPLRDPVKNIWIAEWAMLACAAVIPLALICGVIRSIPWFHILIDCSFGIIGLLPLYITRRWIKQLAVLKDQ